MSHTSMLVVAYATICLLWWGLSRILPFWRQVERPIFSRSWLEVTLALVAVLLVLVIGQLWAHGIRLKAPGAWKPLTESINQVFIFLPVILLPIVRKQGLASVWIQCRYRWARIGVGLGLAMIALLIFALAEGRLSYWDTLKAVFRFGNVHIATQVFLEDFAIALLFVRLVALVRLPWAVLLVAALFAAAHLPALVALGSSPAELASLLRDFGLGVLVIGTIWRGGDILWFFPVHFALDATQFL